MERSQIEEEWRHRLPVKERTASQLIEARAQRVSRAEEQNVVARGKRRRALWKASREEELDVDLLLSIAVEEGTEQERAIARVLAYEAPLGVLNVACTESQQDCVRAYRALSLLLHPDKCSHPRAQEAFAKLGDTQTWAVDRQAWEGQQRERQTQQLMSEMATHWFAQGGAVRRWEGEEAIDRTLGLAEEEVARLWLEENCKREEIRRKRVEDLPPRTSSRRRTQTTWYQSDEFARQENMGRGHNSQG